MSRAHLFRLRRAWMRQPASFASTASGGDHHAPWPQAARDILQQFLPLQRPPNYQLVADELFGCFAFQRDRKSVAAYARRHFPLLVRPADRTPKPRRRWERSRIGELWQHDSSILLAFEKVTDFATAQILLDQELARQNRTVCRTHGLCPNDAWSKAQDEGRDALHPAPDPGLMDLHLALHFSRRCNADHQIDFLGRGWPTAHTHRRSFTLVHHPRRRFWVIAHPPSAPLHRWPDILAKFSL